MDHTWLPPNDREIKKEVINSKNKGDDCFKYAIVAALNYDKINNHPEKPSKLKPFIDNYN